MNAFPAPDGPAELPPPEPPELLGANDEPPANLIVPVDAAVVPPAAAAPAVAPHLPQAQEIEAVEEAARKEGLTLEKKLPMPANNFSLFFYRR